MDFLTLGWGIFAGLVWSRRTGWGCGGIVVPGLLALYASHPARAAATLALGVALAPLLSLCVRVWGLYGRERSGVAMLIALCARALLFPFFPASSGALGWVVSGLVASDAERQGALITLCGAVSSALFAVFSMEIFRVCLGLIFESVAFYSGSLFSV